MRIDLLVLLTIFFGIVSCDSDEGRQRNDFLPSKQVNFILRLDLPQFGDLNFAGNDEFIIDPVNFIQGIYIKNNGPSGFTVFELAEPNHPVGICSVPDKIEGLDFVYKCGEEETRYDLNGIKRGATSNDFTLRRYRAERINQNQLRISF
ncbi:hypothetical protein [Aquimarina agarilytica]|uniref:hypothetical protein n=1 Tax=Aquimarina agarilytica TaxID=1087449 RepID=UPI000289092D|nr:hypothetical protein [Aquimarina agarilytica]